MFRTEQTLPFIADFYKRKRPQLSPQCAYLLNEAHSAVRNKRTKKYYTVSLNSCLPLALPRRLKGKNQLDVLFLRF